MSGRKAQHTVSMAVVVLLAVCSPARADEITVNGDVLHGKVEAITQSTIEFSTEYGKGTLRIPIADVDTVTSEKAFFLVYGADGRATGRLLAVRDGLLLIGDAEETATTVDPATIHQAYRAEVLDGPTGWLRRATALWHGSFDAGYGITKSTTDTTSVSVGFVADRKKKPTRLTFNAGYRYGTQKKSGEEESTTENEIKGLLRGEYDLWSRLFVFVSQDAEYDEIESLSIRAVPKAGLGYRFWETDTGLFQVEAGGAYVYEKFFGGDDDGSFSIAFGKLLEATLPWYGSTFTWRTDYLPSVDDFAGDFLLRSEAALYVPMIRWLKFKLGVSDTYDSTPAEDSDKNTLATTAGLAATY